jgi:hypothetical protein
MGLKDTQLVCGAGGNKYRADMGLLVVLKRLSYPCRFWEMAEDFGLPLNRLCEIFHMMLDLLFDRYQALIEFETWLPFFARFAQIFRAYGSPFPYLVALIDGIFLRLCRPGGLGNKHSRLDQGQFYSGEKAAH